MSIEIHSAKEIDAIRVSCQMAADTLLLVGEKLRAGMTTEEINTIVHEDTLRRDAYPSPLNYHGFPKSVCTSVNDDRLPRNSGSRRCSKTETSSTST